ncbi:Pre-mRNA splicing factor SR-like 1 (AtSRL1) [Durusdinium trenchii]
MMAMPMMNPMMGMGMNSNMGANANMSATPTTGTSPTMGGSQQVQGSPKVPSSAAGGVSPGPIKPMAEAQHSAEPSKVGSGMSGMSGMLQRERSRSRDVDRDAGGGPSQQPEEEHKEPPKEKLCPPCHLHNVKKPNAKCKFCQKWLASQKAQEKEEKEGEPKDEKAKISQAQQAQLDDEEDYSRRTFKCSTLLKDQIFGSSYFKSLLEVSDLEPLAEEIAKYADTLDVYNSGNNVHPSCFICQVYRLFTLPQSEDLDGLLAVLDANPSAKVRCAGVLYVRFVVPPHKLLERLEEMLFDEQELKYLDGDKQVTTTIQEYVENLLIRDKYYNTPLPRIPVKVRQHLEKELAPLSQFRKRMAAMQKALPKKVAGMPVEVYIDGSWHPGHIKTFIGHRRRRVGVHLENGALISSHLGKVILRDGGENKTDERDEKDEKEKGDEKEGDEKKEKDDRKEKRDSDHRPSNSRSRSRRSSRSRHRSRSRRHRSRSPDWTRYKGSIADQSEIERLREKAREEAVVGVGKVYSKRPTTVEGEMWRGSGGDVRVSMLGPQHSSSTGSRPLTAQGHSDPEVRTRISLEEEAEHKRRMREIYEKYGSVSKATSGSSGQRSEIEQPDVLRLG